jgi:hypothetical protein
MKYGRRTSNQLLLPILTFRHPDTEHTIRLVGVMHAASAESWADLNQRLRDLDAAGNVTLLEGIRKPTDAEMEEAGPELRQRVADLRYISEATKDFVHALGLTYQHEGLVKPARARNADLTILELARHADSDAIAKGVVAAKKQGIDVTDDTGAQVASWVVFQIFATLIGTPIRAFLPAAKYLPENLVIQERNAIAIGLALQERSDVVLPWGAAHLPGMVKLLRHNGYRRVDTTWRTTLAREDIRITPSNT